MYVTGGSGSESLWFSDLHFLDVNTLAWEEVALQGPLPAPRDYTAITSLCNWVRGEGGGEGGEVGLMAAVSFACSISVCLEGSMEALTTSVSLTCTSSTSLKVSTLSAPLPVFIDSI